MKVQTPSIVYNLNLLRSTLAHAKMSTESSEYKIHYAIKANANRTILHEIKKFGLGLDCVSGNEVLLGLEMGFDPKDIVFAGVGKRDEELRLAIVNGISCINCESYEELKAIETICKELDKEIVVALRLNPNVDAKTHEYISTGKSENKFGISPIELQRIIKEKEHFSRVKIEGLHFHVGSQITDLAVFCELTKRVKVLYQDLSQHFCIRFINVGGGLGINYENPDAHLIPDFESYFAIFKRDLNLGIPLWFELGRSIVGQIGTLHSQVLYIKEGVAKKFAILDAGMTELLRPALYQSMHKIEGPLSSEMEKYDIVGPICESSDCFAKDLHMGKLERGSRLKIRSVGAYVEQMALRYNMRDPLKIYFEDIS